MSIVIERPAPTVTAERPSFSWRWLRPVGLVALLAVFTTELIIGWPAITGALSHLRTPHLGWLVGGFAAAMATMSCYARMQRHLLHSSGVRVSLSRHVALAYAAHSLSVTLPGGTAFSTRFNYQQFGRLGATPAVAAWCIALSGFLSAAALAVITAATALAAGGTPPWHVLLALTVTALLATFAVRWVIRRPDWLETVLVKVNRLRRRPAGDGLGRIRGFATQLRTARLAPGHGTAAAGFAVLNWLLDAACLWLCLRAVGGTIATTQLLITFCAAMAAASITVIPGILDNALVLGLHSGGVPTTTAIAAVTLHRVISLGFIVGAGWIAWLRTRRSGLDDPADDVLDDLPVSGHADGGAGRAGPVGGHGQDQP